MGNIAPNGGRSERIYYDCGRKISRGSKMLRDNIKEPLSMFIKPVLDPI
jgi:hypothetical protein